ncbi:3-isopropylmalate dehydratase small subunit [Sphingobium chlorophenolicum L-1]|uniref:3-isopropylmalate dehydratase small subunit n=1 Tax=Sphingobium chlorophenolicum L-1 TaxID=690566 RepID=F6F1N6_SPHCR|nr:3-isopropylmalate dehydratase small subunit [Sphingobium chlorophenolicum]AEG51452.1 3-isopropylmalate dehydratase small subunit [Sphingobium chlorophenolicum L-1]
MTPFTSITSVAAALPEANVDTDKILAAQYLKTISRAGLGSRLFSSMRYDEAGGERSGFILNRDGWRDAGILIALENFGCGSSREHAPWALLDFGIRVIIAPSFADIFYNNCFNNGILPVILDRAQVDRLIVDSRELASATMSVDLPSQTVTRANGVAWTFDISPDRKQALLEGRDDIAAALAQGEAITRWEKESALIAPAITGIGAA